MQALWMVLASLIFAVMSVCVKFAAVHFSTFELVFYRRHWHLAHGLCLSAQRHFTSNTSAQNAHLASVHRGGVFGCMVLCHCLSALGHSHDFELHEWHLGGCFFWWAPRFGKAIFWM